MEINLDYQSTELYKERLKITKKSLYELELKLETLAADLAMCGRWKNIHGNYFENPEQYCFTKDNLRAVYDPNVDELIVLIEKTERTRKQLDANNAKANHYRIALIDAANKLVDIMGIIKQSILDVSMTGELKDWSNTVHVGEFFQLDKELFESLDDSNVQLLNKLFDQVGDTYESLVNINGLGVEEE